MHKVYVTGQSISLKSSKEQGQGGCRRHQQTGSYQDTYSIVCLMSLCIGPGGVWGL